MKSYDSRVYSINDFAEWRNQKLLELNPFFQRRPVWSESAKSYLIDTILRGKPIPKIFIRQKVNVTTMKVTREVVDGQQRLRTILSFINDGFVVNRQQNRANGGKHFSQLPEDVQQMILTYEISVDLLVNMPDEEVLDIFSRLNSYSVILNIQEKLNATHFGSFKILADEVGLKYASYWKEQRILNARQILRMQEVNLVADLLIAMLEGIKSKKQIRKFYGLYEKEFDHDVSKLEQQFDGVMSMIRRIFPNGLINTEFVRIHLFYSLFTTIAHCQNGLPNCDARRISLEPRTNLETVRNRLDRVGEIFHTDIQLLDSDEQQFMHDVRRATTDEVVRERRLSFLLNLIVDAQ